ncbi:hypothetical protein DXG01_009127 [Tephrocybe rancida]|nr:hypothetical protein DXG01_009127 [Tephrocybe rancida]
MDREASQLAQCLVERLTKIQPSSRLLVGISGIPASGKSTFASLLTTHGWHLSRAQLDEFPDPKLAHDRRGSHWTFDGLGYVAFIRSLREPLTPNTLMLTAPTFDHALKDPTYDAVVVRPQHRIVIIEGLYTLLSIEPWNEAGLLLDERWYLHSEIDRAQERLVKRHVVTGVAKDMEEAIWRAEENDMPNGRFVIANMLQPTMTVESIEDSSLVSL